VIGASDLDYTIITTEKGEHFRNGGATVSRKSVAYLVVRLATTLGESVRQSLGLHAA